MTEPWRPIVVLAACLSTVVPPGASAAETIEHEELEDEGSSDDGGAREATDGGETIRHEELEGEAPKRDDEEGEESTETIEHGELGDGDDEGSTDASDGEPPPSLLGDETTFGGRWGTAAAIDTWWERDGEDVVEMGSALTFHLEQPVGDEWKARAGVRFDHWMAGKPSEEGPQLLVNADDPRAAAAFQLDESYLLYRGNRWTFRAGHLVTSWGSTSLFRPADVVNPRDLRADVTPGTTRRRALPQASVEVSYVRPNWELEGVVVPFFKPNRVTLFGRDSGIVSLGGGSDGGNTPTESLASIIDPSMYEEVQPLLLASEQPDELPGNASGGVRLTGTRWNTDFGLGLFAGWERTPSFEFGTEDRQPTEQPDGGGSSFRSFYERRATIALDVARYVGPIGLRVDAVFTPARTFVTRPLGSVRRPSVETAVGLSWERLFDGRPLTLTAEWTWIHPFAVDAAPTRWFVRESKRGEPGNQIATFGENWSAAAGVVDWALPWWDFRVGVGTFVDLTDGSWAGRAEFSYEWTSWLETGARGVVFEGPPIAERVSLGGLYDDNDRVGIFVRGDF